MFNRKKISVLEDKIKHLKSSMCRIEQALSAAEDVSRLLLNKLYVGKTMEFIKNGDLIKCKIEKVSIHRDGVYLDGGEFHEDYFCYEHSVNLVNTSIVDEKNR